MAITIAPTNERPARNARERRVTRPTLHDVARSAGVSPSTASRALRGSAAIAPSTCARVQAAAGALGYEASPIISDVMRWARSRGRPARLGTIAYLTFHDTRTAWRSNPTYDAFFEGAKEQAALLGFWLEPVWAAEPGLNARRLTEILHARTITGVVVGPRPYLPCAPILDWAPFYSASVGVPLPGVGLPQASSHHLRSMERLINALTGLGYRRIGLAVHRSLVPKTDHGWLAAFALHQQNLPPEERIPPLTPASWHEAVMANWLEQYQPDVVIGQRADDVLPQLMRLGLRVPDDIGFALLSRPTAPDAPAGIDQRPQLIGAAAVDLIAHQFFTGEPGLPKSPRFILIEGEWNAGPTVRAVTAPRGLMPRSHQQRHPLPECDRSGS